MTTKKQKTIRFLSLEDVMACGGADIRKAMCDMRRGFGLFEQRKIVQPPKTSMKHNHCDHCHDDENVQGLVNTLPATVQYEDGETFFSCKVLGSMPHNTYFGLPRATGLIVLFEEHNKTPLCVMDAQVISATRTGAVSGLVAQKTVKSTTREVALLGAGVNMRTQLVAIKEALPQIERAKVYSPGQTKFSFAKEMSERLNMKIEPFSSPEEVVANQEFVVTCMANLTAPVVRESWFKNGGLTVFNIGCFESDPEIVGTMDRIISDYWPHSRHRGVQTHAVAAERGIISDDQVENVAPLISEKVPGRQSGEERIFFGPTGLGFEDAIIAHRVYKQALDSELGQEIVLWESSKWI